MLILHSRFVLIAYWLKMFGPVGDLAIGIVMQSRWPAINLSAPTFQYPIAYSPALNLDIYLHPVEISARD
jgi:hypothetical protein